MKFSHYDEVRNCAIELLHVLHLHVKTVLQEDILLTTIKSFYTILRLQPKDSVHHFW